MEKHSQKNRSSTKIKKPAVSTELDKAPTGIKGLDEVLHGGVPRGRCTIVTGGPGVGKSVLGLEFLGFSARNGSPGIFVTFEERADAIRTNAMTLGMDLRALEKSGRFFMLDARPNPEAVVSGDFDLKGMLAIIGGKADSMGARHIVFDAIDILLNLFGDASRERKELFLLHNWLLERGFTTLVTVKHQGSSYPDHSFLDFMMDCVIFMDARQIEQITTRRIRVVKYRGSSYNSNEHPFIFKNGIRVIPLSSVLLSRTPMLQRMTSGNRELDDMLNGGYLKSAAILLSGQSGTGKTTAACLFTQRACARKEKVLYISFEESPEEIVSNMLSPGIDLAPALAAGALQFLNFMPESRAAEEHLVDIVDTIDALQPQHVVVDAISACSRMGTTQTAFEFVTRLINACKERGITLMLLNQLDWWDDERNRDGIGISSLIDTMVFIRYKHGTEHTHRIIEIMKSRGSMHSTSIKNFTITNRGLEIGGDVHGGGRTPEAAGLSKPQAKGGSK